jgi:ankyrin repeat protein
MQSIFEHWLGTPADTVPELGNVQRPPTPTDIAVFTPINSPSPSNETIVFNTVPTFVSNASRHTFKMPWTQFQNLMSKMTFPRWELGSQSCLFDAQARVGECRIGDNLRPSSGPFSGAVQLQHIIQSLHPTISDDNSPLALRKPQYFLPRARKSSLDARTHDVVGLSNGMTEPDLLKLLIGTASNNLEIDETTKFVMELLKDKSYETLLKSLLEQKIDTVSAFAEKLLVPAAQEGKWDLVKAIIESGVDVDTRSEDYLGRSQTALQSAVDQGNVDLVRYLIERGARDFSTNFQSQFDKRWITGGKIVDLAVDRGHHKLIENLLQNANSGHVQFPKVTIYHLRNAILLGHIKMVRLLLDSSTGLCETALTTPWLLYEAAALCEDETQASELVDILLSYGLAIASTDAFKRGSILAAASAAPHMTMVKRLMAEGFLTSCVALGHVSFPKNLSEGSGICARTLAAINRKSALHVAVSRGHEDLVKLLLSYGADANQACGSYPIQEAAQNGSVTILTLLIKAGADVNLREYSEDFMKYLPNSDKNEFWPAILLALHRGHIETAEILHSAGAILVEDAQGLYRENALRALVEGGSQSLINSLLHRLLPRRKLESQHAGLLALRFGDDFLDDLTHIGIQVMRLPSIYAIIAREDGSSSIHSDQADNSGEPRDSSAQLFLDIVAAKGGLSVEHSLRALILAGRYKRESIVLMLLRLGFDPFNPISEPGDDIAKDVDARYLLRPGQSAFSVAITWGGKDIVTVLLDWDSGALDDETNNRRHQEMCKAYVLALCDNCLISADDDDPDDNWTTSWLLDLLAEHRIDTVAVEQALGLLYVRKCFYGELCDVIVEQSYHKMKQILAHQTWCGDLVNPPEVDLGNTPLQLLVCANETQHVRKVLDLSADVNAKADDIQGATALQYAAMNGNFEIVDMLIEAGADVNAPPAACNGRTAIEGAAEWGRLDMVHYLLEAGADIQDQKNYRRTVHRAWSEGHRTIARMVYRWKKEKHGEKDCEAPETVVKNMTRLELDGDLPVLCDLGEHSDESDVNSSLDPLAAYKQLRKRRREERKEIEEEIANNEEELSSYEEEFSSDVEEISSDQDILQNETDDE